jgi:hypothetical protein
MGLSNPAYLAATCHTTKLELKKMNPPNLTVEQWKIIAVALREHSALNLSGGPEAIPVDELAELVEGWLVEVETQET